MPRDASGTYTLPIAPFVPLTLAKSADMNTALTDIADALTDSQSRVSPTPAQGDLNLNGHNILNLGSVVGDVIATGSVWANNQQGVFGFRFEAPYYVWHWGVANYYDWFDSTNGVRSWRAAGADVMTLDAAGNLHTTGGLSAAALGVTGTVSANQVTANAITSNGNATVSGTLAVGGDLNGNVINANSIAAPTLNATTASIGTLGVTGNLNGNVVNANSVATTGLTTNTATVNGTLTAGAVTAGALTTGGTLTADRVTTNHITSVDAAISGSATVTGTMTAGAVSTGGTVTGGALSTGGTVTGDALSTAGQLTADRVVANHVTSNSAILAGGGGVVYSGIDANHAVAFIWDGGSTFTVFVDGVRRGSLTMGALAAE
jgi:hypothetical protein